MNAPLLLRRSQLRDLLAEHGISKGRMETMICAGIIEKRYLPKTNKSQQGHRALYSRSQVLAVVGKMLR